MSSCTVPYFPILFLLLYYVSSGATEGTIVSAVGPDELPPPYTPSSSGVPMVTCRVCQAMIDISGKVDQHVVKCNQCNEATVRIGVLFGVPVLRIVLNLSCIFVKKMFVY